MVYIGLKPAAPRNQHNTLTKESPAEAPEITSRASSPELGGVGLQLVAPVRLRTRGVGSPYDLCLIG